MHYRLTHRVIAQTLETADHLGAKIPRAVGAEAAALADADHRITELERSAGSNLPGAVLTAIRAGKDPMTDPDVAVEVVRSSVLGTLARLREGLGQDMHAFLVARTPDLLAAFTTPFDRAAATLTAAAGRLGDVSLDDTAAVVAQGGEAAQVWADAQAADGVVHEIQQVWKQCAGVVPAAQVDPRYRALVVADIPADVFLDDQLTGHNLRAWDIARKGYRLSLATTATIKHRVAAVLEEQDRRRNAAIATQADGWRRHYKVVSR